MAKETVANIVNGSVPYEDAHVSSHILFDALTLIYAATNINEEGAGLVAAEDGLTDNKSLVTNLLMQASAKVATAIKTLDV